jgi:hypothetical protein
LPERLAVEVDLLEAKPEIGLVCAVTALLNDDGTVSSYAPHNFKLREGHQYPQDRREMVRLLYLRNGISNPTCMYRRSLLETIVDPYGQYRIHEDWFFLLRVAHREQIWGIPSVLAKARMGKSHTHLYSYAGPTLEEVCRFKRDVYKYFKNHPESPIDYALYLKSMSISLTPLGRYLGGWKGYLKMLQAVLYDPSNRYGWESLWEFSARALRKGMRLIAKPVEFRS